MEWISEILAFILGGSVGFGIAISIKIRKSNKLDASITQTEQRDLKAQGSIAGRDIITHKQDD